MIHTDRHTFLQEVGEFVQRTLPNPDAHKKTSVFTVGDPKIGHYLRVDSESWSHDLNGVNVSRQTHIASPLANLQAAAVFFGV